MPRQFANDLEQGFFLMEDFGDKLLSSVLSPLTARTHLPQVLEQLVKLAVIPVTDLNLLSLIRREFHRSLMCFRSGL